MTAACAGQAPPQETTNPFFDTVNTATGPFVPLRGVCKSAPKVNVEVLGTDGLITTTTTSGSFSVDVPQQHAVFLRLSAPGFTTVMFGLMTGTKLIYVPEVHLVSDADRAGELARAHTTSSPALGRVVINVITDLWTPDAALGIDIAAPYKKAYVAGFAHTFIDVPPGSTRIVMDVADTPGHTRCDLDTNLPQAGIEAWRVEPDTTTYAYYVCTSDEPTGE